MRVPWCDSIPWFMPSLWCNMKYIDKHELDRERPTVLFIAGSLRVSQHDDVLQRILKSSFQTSKIEIGHWLILERDLDLFNSFS